MLPCSTGCAAPPRPPHRSDAGRPGREVPISRCTTCNRPPAICICDKVKPLTATTSVLILQHPQEPDEVLGTAQILAASLPTARIAVGLSWPNLAGAWGGPAEGRWGVLWRGGLPEGVNVDDYTQPVTRLDRHGSIVASPAPLDGIVALDGTWSQAKTLWWRNPWLLRLDRILLRPTEPGIYGKVRPEPNRQSVSTLEAVADALAFNGEPAETRTELRRWMRTLVQRARDTDPRKKPV